MEKATLEFLTKELEVDVASLNDYDQIVIEIYESNGLLKNKSLRHSNIFITGSFVRLLASNNPHQFILDFVNAINKELEIALTLSTEWFTELFQSQEPLLKGGLIDDEVVTSVWKKHYDKDVLTLFLFDKKNSDYKNLANNYQRFLFNLYRFCGLPHNFIESFFEEDFQNFYTVLIDIIVGIANDDLPAYYSTIKARLNIDTPADQIENKEQFNLAVECDLPGYLDLIKYFIDRFGRIRKCTEAIIESHLAAESPNPDARLRGNADLQISAFKDFNALLLSVIETETESINRKHKANIIAYLNAVASQTINGSGFMGLAARQVKFQNEFDPEKDADAFAAMTPDQKRVKIKERNKDIDDLSILHRFKLILKGRDGLKEKEKMLFYEKVSEIVNSKSVNFYADIIELYFYFLAKASGIPIELLESRVADGKKVSTCDYKFGVNFAADCKCIITDNMQMHNISKWCEKIGLQVDSTIGYEKIEFGGGVIALKDQDIGFLRPLRDFKGIDKYELEERAFVIQLLLEIYSEFRRHTMSNAGKVKFIALYYLPSNHITTAELDRLETYSIKQVNEIMAVFTTKYASDQEFSAISEAFRSASPFIFRFNNKLAS
jgi:hypothetical protein